MSRWPHDDPASLAAFYGDPAKGEPGKQLMPLTPPFQMYYAGKPVPHIMFHRKAAPALKAALDAIWEHYGRDQAKVDASGISRFSGAYNPRMIRGSTTKWSNHAYGAAIDFDAEHNGFNTGHGTMPQAVVDCFKAQGALWGGDYQGRTDPMHFEFCSREAIAKPVGLLDTPQADGDGDDEQEDDSGGAAMPSGSSFDTMMKLLKSKTQWASTALGGISVTSVLGFLADYRVILALGAVGLAAFIIYERSKKP